MTPFDLDSLRARAAELDARPVPVPTGDREQVEAKVRHHAAILTELLDGFRQYSDQVFRAFISPDAVVSEAWRELLAVWLAKAKPAAALGRQFAQRRWGQRDHLPPLDDLHYLLAEVDYLLLHWSPPARSVTPGPRTRIPEAVAEKMRARLRAVTGEREPSEVAGRELPREVGESVSVPHPAS